MKKAIFLLAALLLTGAAQAQRHEKNILGVRAGLNVSHLTDKVSGDLRVLTDPRVAYHVAVTDQILLSRGVPFYLETGLAFTSLGGDTGKEVARPLYLQVPLLINYHFDFGDLTFQPFAGLYYGFGVGGDLKYDDDWVGNPFKEKEDYFGSDSNIGRSDLGVRLGVGLVFKRFFLGVHYDLGCLNILKSDAANGETIRNNTLSISVGYNF